MKTSITFKNALAKQLVEDWGSKRGFDAVAQIRLHLEQRFGVTFVEVEGAQAQADLVLLHLVTDRWDGSKEFALLPNGSLAW